MALLAVVVVLVIVHLFFFLLLLSLLLLLRLLLLLLLSLSEQQASCAQVVCCLRADYGKLMTDNVPPPSLSPYSQDPHNTLSCLFLPSSSTISNTCAPVQNSLVELRKLPFLQQFSISQYLSSLPTACRFCCSCAARLPQKPQTECAAPHTEGTEAATLR